MLAIVGDPHKCRALLTVMCIERSIVHIMLCIVHTPAQISHLSRRDTLEHTDRQSESSLISARASVPADEVPRVIVFAELEDLLVTSSTQSKMLYMGEECETDSQQSEEFDMVSKRQKHCQKADQQ